MVLSKQTKPGELVRLKSAGIPGIRAAMLYKVLYEE
jgi:hypothetical protein